MASPAHSQFILPSKASRWSSGSVDPFYPMSISFVKVLRNQTRRMWGAKGLEPTIPCSQPSSWGEGLILLRGVRLLPLSLDRDLLRGRCSRELGLRESQVPLLDREWTHKETASKGSGFRAYLDTVKVEVLIIRGDTGLMSILHILSSGVPGLVGCFGRNVPSSSPRKGIGVCKHLLRVSELLGSGGLSVAGLPLKWSEITGELTRGTWLRSYGGHLPESEQSFAGGVIGGHWDGHLKGDSDAQLWLCVIGIKEELLPLSVGIDAFRFLVSLDEWNPMWNGPLSYRS
ncbi:hypothetical protein PIB30_073788 [Stylosanthes scabra]|uniref:Uncharacterized protein n=1 Tax=Stylosanthes scabra TaxID=79078 RepID=A0ABU6ZN45_9FABA|nr:hypothetical protein [Stylosanthes scabra]